MSSIYYLYHTVVSVPLTGVLVRYRASYNPKVLEVRPTFSSTEQAWSIINVSDQNQKNLPPVRVVSVSDKDAGSGGAIGTTQESTIQTDGESCGPMNHPVTFLWVLKRTYKVQGFDGLSKGLLPTLIFSFLWPTLLGYLGPSPPTFLLSLKQSFIFSIFYIPVLTTIYRIITTSHKLEALGRPHLEEHIRHLFTQYERTRWWAIYLTPGLLPAMTLVAVISTLCILPLNKLIWASYEIPDSFKGFYSEFFSNYLGRISGSILLCCLGTMVLAPLEVVITRLIIQKNHEAPEIFGFSWITKVWRPRQEQGHEESVEDQRADIDIEKGPVSAYSSNLLPDDVVVQLRHEFNLPKKGYTGLLDCVMTIVKEEGISVLYRGAYITFITTELWMIWSF